MKDVHIMYIVNYYLYYAIIGYVAIRNWKVIWKGICGSNGIPQPNELAKFVGLGGLIIAVNEILFMQRVPNIQFLMVLLGLIGVGNIGALKRDNIKKVLGVKDKQEEEKH